MIVSSAMAARPEDAPRARPEAGRAIRFPEPGLAPHGAAEAVSVRGALENGSRSEALLERLLVAARQGPVCLHPVDMPAGDAGIAEWRRFCDWLQNVLLRNGVSLPGLATCVHSHHLPLAKFHAATESFFGAGQRFVLLDGLQMQSQCNEIVAAISATNWTYLWRERESANRVFPVYGGFVKSTCPLLADEAAVTTLPGTGIQVPAQSAWLPVHMDLGALADMRGVLDRVNLRRTVTDAVQTADRLIDQSQWPGRQRQADARLNRRIAVIVTGIGDLVVRRDEDPGALSCLRSMHQLIDDLRRELYAVTSRLARQCGEVPSLSRACPPGNWFQGSHHQAWQARFDKARRDAAVRHRNLLVLSPYSVLPSASRPTPRFMDLLPLLGLADAWAFAGSPRLAGWNVTQFKYFHMRARAIIQASQGTSRVAAGV